VAERIRAINYAQRLSACDDEETATLLLRIGWPLLNTCYLVFFNFDLLAALDAKVGRQMGVAVEVYQKTRAIAEIRHSYCFSAFAHLIRHSVRHSFIATWENNASVHAEEVGSKFEDCHTQKIKIERVFSSVWLFDCPICDEISTFACELDESQLDGGVIALKRAACASCDLIVRDIPFLATALVGDALAHDRQRILRAFGIADANT
jgi:hypothetical protein